jgi:hypothetical protein
MDFSKQIALTAFLSLSFLCTALAQQQRWRIDVPIVIGGDKQINACAATGEVGGLDSQGSGFLSVQTGPDRAYRKIDRLFNGNKIYICDQIGSWYSVIYSESRELTQECGVGKPRETRQAYTGPCRYGWAEMRYIRPISGIVR